MLWISHYAHPYLFMCLCYFSFAHQEELLFLLILPVSNRSSAVVYSLVSPVSLLKMQYPFFKPKHYLFWPITILSTRLVLWHARQRCFLKKECCTCVCCCLWVVCMCVCGEGRSLTLFIYHPNTHTHSFVHMAQNQSPTPKGPILFKESL